MDNPAISRCDQVDQACTQLSIQLKDVLFHVRNEGVWPVSGLMRRVRSECLADQLCPAHAEPCDEKILARDCAEEECECHFVHAVLHGLEQIEIYTQFVMAAMKGRVEYDDQAREQAQWWLEYATASREQRLDMDAVKFDDEHEDYLTPIEPPAWGMPHYSCDACGRSFVGEGGHEHRYDAVFPPEPGVPPEYLQLSYGLCDACYAAPAALERLKQKVAELFRIPPDQVKWWELPPLFGEETK
jgi:hypothetical protein